MASPSSEIVVSTEPPPSSPPQTKQREPTPEEMAVEQPSSLQHDINSKKSFKRKLVPPLRFHVLTSRYRKLLNKYLKIRASNSNLHLAFAKALSTASQLSNENAYLTSYPWI